MHHPSSAQVLFDFQKDDPKSSWRITDDVVMGGRSEGHFEWTDKKYGRFYGHVSLENNGGFSSVQHYFEPVSVQPETMVAVRLKGDGKPYQLRVKAEQDERFWYVTTFETSGDWQEIRLPLSHFQPQFRGRKLDRPNFDREQIAALAFLIANGKAQDFSLKIESVRLK